MLAQHAGVTASHVSIDAGNAMLSGDLHIAPRAIGLVVFAHGSGSNRQSPRNLFMADAMHEAGLSTLLFDLLTPEEQAQDDSDGAFRFNTPHTASRLIAAVDFCARDHALAGYPLGCFGASTGAAAALAAAASRPNVVKAVVSRGGRPDLAADSLSRVHAPTLLIVGGNDEDVLQLNRRAATLMHSTVQLQVVAGATHLFPEPGAMEHVADLAMKWFRRYLTVPDSTE